MIDLIPEEELKRHAGINFAPMVDFLFLIIAVFAVFLVARSALYRTDVDLVTAKPAREDSVVPSLYTSAPVVLSVLEDGSYRWVGPFQEYVMQDVEAVQKQLAVHAADGPKPKILLKVDSRARWESIARLIFAVRETGFPIYPVYEAADGGEEGYRVMRGVSP